MKKIVFAMGLLVSIFLGQNIYAQCMDTLTVRMDSFYSFWIKGYNINPLDSSTIITADSTKDEQSMLYLCIAFNNISEETYIKKDTFGFHVVLATEGDTIFDRIFFSVSNSGLRPGDTVGIVHDSCSISYQYLKKGTYNFYASVIYTSIDGYFCDSIVELSSKTVTFYVDTKAPVRETLAESTMNVFPNPASEQLNVTCGEEMRSIALFNTAGQRVRQMEPCGSEVQIPLSGLPRGLYLLRIQTANGSAVRKVVVE